jgi:hypothetical protein
MQRTRFVDGVENPPLPVLWRLHADATSHDRVDDALSRRVALHALLCRAIGR